MQRAALAVLVLLLAGCAAPPAATCGSGSEYRNLDKTFRLCVPSGWQAQEHVYGRELVLYSPLDSDKDVFQENINIGRETVAANQTLALYVDRTVADLETVQNFTLESRHSGTLGQLNAEVLVYRAVLAGVPVRTHQAIALHGNLAHVMTAIIQDGREALFQSAIDSVQGSYRPLDARP